jgi:antitoxin component YwqK of YwqJK toxin-antitoxin module
MASIVFHTGQWVRGAYTGNFNNGKMDGKWEGWYKNGRKKYETYYTDDLKNGIDIYWFENSIKKSEGGFKKGEKDGKWTEWSEKGVLLTQEKYKSNLKDGLSVYYDKFGAKYKEQNFINGRPDGKWIEYNQKGGKSAEGYYKLQLKDGIWQYWDVQGNLVYKIVYDKGRKIKEDKPMENKKKKQGENPLYK